MIPTISKHCKEGSKLFVVYGDTKVNFGFGVDNGFISILHTLIQSGWQKSFLRKKCLISFADAKSFTHITFELHPKE